MALQTATKGSPYNVVKDEDEHYINVTPKDKKRFRSEKIVKIYVFDDDDLEKLKNIPRENFSDKNIFSKFMERLQLMLGI